VSPDSALLYDNTTLISGSLARPNVAPLLGPILGGVISSKLGWNWIFWFLCILSGACLLIIVILLPETARNVVGNGRIPAKGIYRSGFRPLQPQTDGSVVVTGHLESRKLKFPNPLDCLTVILRKDSFIVILSNGIMYMTYCCVQATLSSLFIRLYGFHDLQAGLIYIPFGVGCLLASYFTGINLRVQWASTQ